jgi:hypothetical protein
VNELAMNLTSERVEDRYLKVFIVAQTPVAEVLSKLFALARMTVIERISETPMLAADVRSANQRRQVRSLAMFTSVANAHHESQSDRSAFVPIGHPTDAARLLGCEPVSFLFSEKAAKRDRELPVTIDAEM